MGAQLEGVMSKKTNEELQKIIGSRAVDYRPEAIKAAEQEIKKRNFFKEKISKYTDEQILEILESEKGFKSFQIEFANKEVEKRKLKLRLEQNRVIGLNEDVINNRLDYTQSILGKENAGKGSEQIPFGGILMDGGDLKDKTTDELLRIQIVQMQKLLQEYSNNTKTSQELERLLINKVLAIYSNVQFWFWLTLLSIIVGFIAVVAMSS